MSGRGVGWAGWEEGREDFVPGAEGLLLTIDQQQDFVGDGQDARAVGHDDEGGATTAAAVDQLCQGLIAGFVEAGVGLVEDHEGRLAIDRAGQADALALAAGQGGATLADAGVITTVAPAVPVAMARSSPPRPSTWA